MIVAFDYRYACDHFAGIGRHADALLRALLELPGDERYHVLWNPRERNTRHDLEVLRSHPRVRWVEREYGMIHPWGAVQVGGWLRKERPDVYLSPFSLRPVASGRPEVLTLHDVSALRGAHIPSRVSQCLFVASLMMAVRAAAILTDSEFSRGEIETLLPGSVGRVRAIHLGVPPARDSAGPAVRPSGMRSERFALVVGDNRPRKNLRVLAEAWQLEGRRPEWSLVAVGQVDPRFPALLDMAAGAPAGSVRQLGWLLPEELEWLYANAEVLLLPSRYEGFGLPLLEAMAAGVPAIVSDIPVFHEIGGDAPAFVPPDDPRAWANAVTRLAANPAERERMRLAGLARASRFTYQRTAEATLRVLRGVVSGGRT